jgi:CRP-like cAMP-binding protein
MNERDEEVEDLIERSSLGSLGAQRLRGRTLSFQVGAVRRIADLRSQMAHSGPEQSVTAARTLVGEISVLDGRPRSASVVALDDVDGVLVSGDRFRAFLRTNPDAALELLSNVVSRLREADRRRAEFGAYDVASWVARLLLDLADRFGSPAPDGSGATITVALSQHDLAGTTGSSREAVARALRRLRESGGIVTQRRRIIVLRPDLLREVAESP